MSGQRTYDHATNDFVEWYCSEPRLAFNRTVVLRYRIYLEQKGYAPNTINLRLAAVRRVAYEACDSGLLSPELGAGIRRVKGVRRLGVRVGNWLTPAQGKLLLERSDTATLRGKRNHAILAMLLGCGLRRGELLSLAMASIQVRDDHWVIADLKGKAGHIRTVPVPQWVKAAVDVWSTAAGITKGTVFRSINKSGSVWGDGMTPKVLWEVVKKAATRAGIEKLAPHDLRRHALAYAISPAENSTKFSFCWGTFRFKRPNDTSGVSRGSVTPLTTSSELSLSAVCNRFGLLPRGGRSRPARPLATTRNCEANATSPAIINERRGAGAIAHGRMLPLPDGRSVGRASSGGRLRRLPGVRWGSLQEGALPSGWPRRNSR